MSEDTTLCLWMASGTNVVLWPSSKCPCSGVCENEPTWGGCKEALADTSATPLSLPLSLEHSHFLAYDLIQAWQHLALTGILPSLQIPLERGQRAPGHSRAVLIVPSQQVSAVNTAALSRADWKQTLSFPQKLLSMATTACNLYNHTTALSDHYSATSVCLLCGHHDNSPLLTSHFLLSFLISLSCWLCLGFLKFHLARALLKTLKTLKSTRFQRKLEEFQCLSEHAWLCKASGLFSPSPFHLLHCISIIIAGLPLSPCFVSSVKLGDRGEYRQ